MLNDVINNKNKKSSFILSNSSCINALLLVSRYVSKILYALNTFFLYNVNLTFKMAS